jgi:hypothetical protein
MGNQNHLIEEQSIQKMKKQWLVSFLTYTTLLILSILLTYFGYPVFKELSTNVVDTQMIIANILVWFLITFYCTYKKNGTAWLLLTLISLPLKELAQISNGKWDLILEWNALGWIFALVYSGIEVLFWINCFMLCKINTVREYNNVQAWRKKNGSESDPFVFKP